MAVGKAAAVSLLVGLLTLGIPVLWGVSFLWSRSLALHLLAAMVWLVLALAAVGSSAAVLSPGSYLLSGVAMGWALARHWRTDAVLGLAVLLPAVLALGTFAQVPMEEMLRQSGRDLMDVARQRWAETDDQAVRQAMLAQSERGLAATIELWVRFWPSFFFLAVLAHTGAALLLVRWVARTGRFSAALPDLPPFHQWRAPFYVVWLLAAGLALVLLRMATLTQIGVNVILVAAVVLSVQGLAVQSCWLGRFLPAWLRIAFWTVSAVLVLPLVLLLLSSAVLGLIDQWWDLRRIPEAPGGQ
jgi:hypothetical protein